MPRRYWLPIVAAVGLILASQAHAQDIGRGIGSKPTAAQGQTKPAVASPPAIPTAVQNDIHSIAAALNAANDERPSQTEEDRAKRDLAAQEEMAAWVPWMFGLGGLEILITLAGVILVWRTLHHTREAARAAKDAVIEAKEATKATREIGEAQVRAYLHIKSLKASFHGGMNEPSFNATIVNTGDSPAHGVVCGVQVRYSGTEFNGLGRPHPQWREALGKFIPTGGEESVSFDSTGIGLNPKQEDMSQSEDFGVLMSVRVVFAYRDVFKKSWDDEAYFVGFVRSVPPDKRIGIFSDNWDADLRPVSRPQNWGAESQD